MINDISEAELLRELLKYLEERKLIAITKEGIIQRLNELQKKYERGVKH